MHVIAREMVTLFSDSHSHCFSDLGDQTKLTRPGGKAHAPIPSIFNSMSYFKLYSLRRNQINVTPLHVIQLSPPLPPALCSPVEIVEEGEDEEGQLAPGLLQAELERVAVHHRRRVVEQLLSVRWGMEVPTTGGQRPHHG